jgi:hypothetical protein
MDVFNAGVGDDMIIINASNITALEQTGIGNRARVDGGLDRHPKHLQSNHPSRRR